MSSQKTLFSRIHSGRRWFGNGEDVWERLFADNHLKVWGAQLVIQEHVQAEAIAGKVAWRCRQLCQRTSYNHTNNSDLFRPHRKETQEKDLHWEHSSHRTWESVSEEPKAYLGRNTYDWRQPLHGKGSGSGVVLQQVIIYWSTNGISIFT